MLRINLTILTAGMLALLLVPFVFAQDDNIIVSEADVSAIEVTEGSNAVTLTVSGTMPDACTEPGEPEISVGDTTIDVMLPALRPADQMCAQVLSEYETEISVDPSGLSVGDVTVTVNNAQTTFTYTGGASAQANEAFENCPTADENRAVYIPELDEPEPYLPLCFAYPADYRVDAVGDTLLITPENPEEVENRPTALITREPFSAATPDEIQAELINRFGLTDEAFTRDDAGWVETNLPDIVPARAAYIAGEMDVFSLSVTPYDNADATELYAVLRESIMLVDVAYPRRTTLPDAGLEMAVPSNWTVEQTDGAYALTAPDGARPIMTATTVNDLPSLGENNDVAAYADAVRERFAEDGDEFVVISPFTSADGYEGVQVFPPSNLCTAIFIPVGDETRVISVSRDACNQEGNIDQPDVERALNSIRMIESAAG